jgi:diguanylate cyclase (GGDEF)-like protein/PAS domain S-box-containing protein
MVRNPHSTALSVEDSFTQITPGSLTVERIQRGHEPGAQMSPRAGGSLVRLVPWTILRHAIFASLAFLAYFLLARPEVILPSPFSSATWFPAAGLAFAVLLGMSPRYMPLFAVANGVAGVVIYHQPAFTCSVLLGAPLGTAVYAYVAHLLRSVMKIDTSLVHRRDVLKYLSGALTGAVLSTVIGVACLVADCAVPATQFWRLTLTWYFSDAIALFSVTPFLLIHVLPLVQTKLGARRPDVAQTNSERVGVWRLSPLKTTEFVGQALCFLLVLWFTFGDAASNPHFYLLFLPIIWIAIREGIRGVASGLFFLNFGVVCGLQLSRSSSPIPDELSGVLLVLSGTGLILGSVITERQSTSLELAERTSLLNTLIEHSPFGISVVGLSGETQLINEAFTHIFQYRPVEIIGRKLARYIVPPSQESEVTELIQQLKLGRSVVKNLDLQRKDGQLVHVSLHALAWFENGTLEGTYLIYRDISEQIKAAAAAQEYEEAMHSWVGQLEMRTMQISLLNEMSGLLQCAKSSDEAYAIARHTLKKLFASAHSGVLYILDPLRNTFEARAVWGKAHPIPNSFAPTQCWSLRLKKLHWSERPGHLIACEHLSLSMAASYLCVPLMANGEIFGVLHLRCELHEATGEIEAAQRTQEGYERLAVACATQIALSLTNLQLRESLREQSIRDPLTGLFNRRFLEETLEKELQRAKRKTQALAVIFLDIDHFKRFNDRFGHDAGDSVLKSLAAILRRHFRGEDFICRYGGEEFAVILPDTALQDAAIRAESLRAAARDAKLIHRDLALGQMTLSAGIAGFPDHGENAAALLERADRCLYESKENGRDRVTVATL